MVTIDPLSIEQEFALNIDAMMRRGVAFDRAFAERESEIRLVQLRGLEDDLDTLCGRRVETTKTPAYWEDPVTGRRAATKKAYKERHQANTVELNRLQKGPMKTKEILFNPGSPRHIIGLLETRYRWKPVEFTDGGAPSTTSKVLGRLGYPETDLICEWSDLNKTLQYVSTGEGSYLNCLAEDGRIHGYVNHMGAVTSRCTHSRPNLANVPRRDSARWARQCFIPTPGKKLIGADASRLELAMLGHALAPFDGGRYAAIMADPGGDTHAQVVEALGLASRDAAKTFTYAHNYGAGNAKLGAILGFEDDDAIRRFARANPALAARGVAIFERQNEAPPPWYYGAYWARGELGRQAFSQGILGLDKLMESVQAQARRGYLDGLDGRKVPCRSEHSALNALLQSSGAIVVKVATNAACQYVREWGMDAGMVLHVHDEFQFEALPKYVEDLASELPLCFTAAGEDLNLACPLYGESKVGNSWAETH